MSATISKHHKNIILLVLMSFFLMLAGYKLGQQQHGLRCKHQTKVIEEGTDNKSVKTQEIKTAFLKKEGKRLTPQEMVEAYGKGIENVPYSHHDQQLPFVQSCNHPDGRCHLNRDCYDYLRSLTYPAGCQARQVSPEEARDCVTLRPLVILGDSRSHEVTNGIYRQLDKWQLIKHAKQDNVSEKTDVLMGMHTFSDEVSGHLLMRMYYIFDYLPGVYPNWTFLSSTEPNTKFNLLIGGLAAHVVSLEREGSSEFEMRLKKHLQLLKEVILDSRKWQLKGVIDEIIYFMDTLPLRLPYQSNFKIESTIKFNRVVSELLKQYDYVKVWNSHLPLAKEHRHICERFLIKQRMDKSLLENPNLEAISDTINENFKCPNTWHMGHHYGTKSALHVSEKCCSDVTKLSMPL